MSHNFKPGDLALTLISLPVLETGSVVELLSRVPKGDRMVDRNGDVYWAAVDGWMVSHSEAGSDLVFADVDLMPLRGDFTPERQKSQEVPA